MISNNTLSYYLLLLLLYFIFVNININKIEKSYLFWRYKKFTIFPNTFFHHLSSLIDQSTNTMLNTLHPFALINIMRLVHIFSIAMFFTVLVISFVIGSITPFIDPFSMKLTIKPLTIVLWTILISYFTSTLG